MDCKAKTLKIQKKKYFLWLTLSVMAIGFVYLSLRLDRGASGAVELKSQLSVPQPAVVFTYHDWDMVHLQPPSEEILKPNPEQELLDLLRSSILKIEEPVRGKPKTAAKSSSQWNTVRMMVTGYCACPQCCGKFSDGFTANMHKIRPGDVFVAADKKIPFGTRVIIPGYNRGRSVEVKDRGGLIRGNHLDLYFSSHKTAQKWGVKYLDVRVRLDE